MTNTPGRAAYREAYRDSNALLKASRILRTRVSNSDTPALFEMLAASFDAISAVNERYRQMGTALCITDQKIFNRFTLHWQAALARHAMRLCGQNQVRAAMLLGLSRNTLRKLIGKRHIASGPRCMTRRTR